MTEPQPRIDADGVPLCQVSCPHWSFDGYDNAGNFGECLIQDCEAIAGIPCYPAVAAMAARMKELKAENAAFREQAKPLPQEPSE